MKKYGYKNIAHRDEVAKNTEKMGKHEFKGEQGNYVTRYDFINWSDQFGGLPGQTNYDVKDLDSLLRAGEIVSSTKK